jgi:hypothetical protein
VLGRINVDGFVHAAMHREIGLTVSIKVRFPQHDPTVYRLLEDSGLKEAPFQASNRGSPTLTDTSRMFIYQTTQMG